MSKSEKTSAKDVSKWNRNEWNVSAKSSRGSTQKFAQSYASHSKRSRDDKTSVMNSRRMHLHEKKKNSL